jgi:(E)-4-hydroxy-3-methylbut-2-enyl-diphosphate synthase
VALKGRTGTVKIGGFDHIKPVLVGGANPVVIQTMWKEPLTRTQLEGESGEAITERIRRLWDMGCRLLRFAVPSVEAAEIVGALASGVSMPLVADIHFDYRIALRCLDFPIAKIRINPGNIGARDRVEKVLSRAGARGIPLRIGVNAGSLPRDLAARLDRRELSRVEALAAAAEREIALFREFGFSSYLVSMKASSIADTIKVNRLFAERSDAPLHIGVTEAGPLIAGVTRNAVALHALLSEGLGDTVRVSLSDTMENEVIAAREILNTVDGGGGVNIVSCPRCGRNSFDTHGFIRRWLERLYSLEKDLTVAVMGCVVNGPGEARHADLGITGAGNKVLIFARGKVIRTIDAAEADQAFLEELEKL